MPLDGKILRELIEHERCMPTTIRTSQGNVSNLPHLKHVVNIGIKIQAQLGKIPCCGYRTLSYQDKL